MAAVINQKQRFIQDMDGSVISCTELVNCLDDGTIQTRNSMKYHSREIKRKFGIQFKYHYLRHTYGTMLANMNLPAHILKNQMGHARIQVTMQYYVANTDDSIKILKEIVNQL